MSKFSSTLQLSDFDDFITPSQECIKPINTKTVDEKKSSVALVGIKGKPNPKKVEITLNDCLACSGCITSAETLLVTSQSHQQFLKVVEENRGTAASKRKVIVVTISPQAQASLAVEYKLTHTQVRRALHNFFTRYEGVEHVLDEEYAHHISLVESAREFVERYEKSRNEGGNNLPIMTSSCPGWICYVEKTHGEMIIPHLSRVKSAQQISASLIKRVMTSQHGDDVTPDRVYHVTVMPCYDKKLEASREDFYNQIYATRDVDLVLTSGEIVQMLKENDQTLDQFAACSDETNSAKTDDKVEEKVDLATELFRTASLLSTKKTSEHKGDDKRTISNKGSGGYLEFVFKYAAKKLFNMDVNGKIEYKQIRNNKDFQEVKLMSEDGNKVLLKFGLAYGFRSIQNCVQKMKRKMKFDFDYIEVMACPSGCLNGGGQVKPAINNRENLKERLEQVEKFFDEIDLSVRFDFDDFTNRLFDDDEVRKNETTTQYRAIEKTENINVKW